MSNQTRILKSFFSRLKAKRARPLSGAFKNSLACLHLGSACHSLLCSWIAHELIELRIVEVLFGVNLLCFLIENFRWTSDRHPRSFKDRERASARCCNYVTRRLCCRCFHRWCADLLMPSLCLLMWTRSLVLALSHIQGSSVQLDSSWRNHTDVWILALWLPMSGSCLPCASCNAYVIRTVLYTCVASDEWVYHSYVLLPAYRISSTLHIFAVYAVYVVDKTLLKGIIPQLVWTDECCFDIRYSDLETLKHLKSGLAASHFLINKHFYASVNVVAGGIMHLGCLWMNLCVCVSRTYLEKYWTYFHQTFSTGALWDEDEHFKFRGQKVKVQGHSGSSVLGNALLTSLTQCLEHCWIEFRQDFSIDAFLDKDEHFKFWVHTVKFQGHSGGQTWVSYCSRWRHAHRRLGVEVSFSFGE